MEMTNYAVGFVRCYDFENIAIKNALSIINDCYKDGLIKGAYSVEFFYHGNDVYCYVFTDNRDSYFYGLENVTGTGTFKSSIFTYKDREYGFELMRNFYKDNLDAELFSIFGCDIFEFRDKLISYVSKNMHFTNGQYSIPAPYFTINIANIVIMEKYKEYLFVNKWAFKESVCKYNFTEFSDLLVNGDLMRYMFTKKPRFFYPNSCGTSFEKLSDGYIILDLCFHQFEYKKKKFLIRIHSERKNRYSIISCITRKPFDTFEIKDEYFYILTSLGFSCVKENERMNEIERFLDLFSQDGDESIDEWWNDYHFITINNKKYINSRYDDKNYLPLDYNDIHFLSKNSLPFINF